MNLTVITGTIATIPRYRIRGFVPTTTFDIHVDVARHTHTFHIRAMNNLAKGVPAPPPRRPRDDHRLPPRRAQ